MPTIMAVLVFICVWVVSATLLFPSARVAVSERLQSIHRENPVIVSGTDLQTALSLSLFRRLCLPALLSAGQFLVGLTPPKIMESAQKRLIRAGLASDLSAATFQLLRLISALAGIAGGAVVLGLYAGPAQAAVPMAVCIVVVGLALPDSLIAAKTRRRQLAIRKSLPSVIDLLAVSAEAGAGLDGALEAVVNRKRGALVDEFRRLLAEMAVGKKREAAWQALSDRVNVLELNMLIWALRQAEELGVGTAKTLRTQADALRNRRSLEIRYAAATLALKLLFPLIFCILPALFIVVLGPGLMSIREAVDFLGW